MDWYYAANGQQVGPIPESQLDELIRNRTVEGTTLVWRDGLTEWQPLQTVRPTGAVPPLPPLPVPGQGSLKMATATSVCAECQRSFPQSEMVVLNRSWVCEQCKPVFVQRMKEGVGPSGGQLWRFKRQLVCRPGASLPDRCVKCNVPTHGSRMKRQLYWHPSLVYLLILVNLLVYVIVAMIVRKRATLQVGVCAAHRKRRLLIIAGSWLTALAGMALIFYGLSNNQGGLSLIGLIAFLGAIIVGAVLGPLVSAVKIDNEYVWVKGVCREYLETLPEWSGPA